MNYFWNPLFISFYDGLLVGNCLTIFDIKEEVLNVRPYILYFI